MKKKLIKLTESDLHQMIMNATRKALMKEWDDKEFPYSTNTEDQPDFENKIEPEPQNGETILKLMKIRSMLAEIMDSGFIPFASPSPSSTEQVVKDSIVNADKLIGTAIYKCKELRYGF